MSVPIPFLSSATLAGLVGKPVMGGHPDMERVTPRVDSAGATSQVDRINVTGATNSETYTIRVSSTTPGEAGRAYDVSAETDGSATQAELTTAIVAALRGDPRMSVLLASVEAGTNVVTVTWRSGKAGTVSFPDNPSTDLTLTSLSTAGQSAYLFGRFAKVAGVTSDGVQQTIEPLSALAGPVVTIAVDTNDDGSDVTVNLLHAPAGEPMQQISITATAGASADLTTEAIRAAAAAALTGSGAVVTGSAADDEVTIELPVGDSAVVQSVTVEGTLAVSASVAAGDALPRMTYIRDGGWTALAAPGAAAPTGPAPLTGVSTVDVGGAFQYVCEPPADSVTFGAGVYIETAAGANLGRPYAGPSPSRARLPGARWVSLSTADGASVGILEL